MVLAPHTADGACVWISDQAFLTVDCLACIPLWHSQQPVPDWASLLYLFTERDLESTFSYGSKEAVDSCAASYLS